MKKNTTYFKNNTSHNCPFIIIVIFYLYIFYFFQKYKNYIDVKLRSRHNFTMSTFYVCLLQFEIYNIFIIYQVHKKFDIINLEF